MKRTFILLILLVSATAVSAQAPTEKTLLWQVSGKGVQQPSYLFGTLHLVCPADLVMPAVVREKFGSTRQLYLEIDMDEPGLMMQLMGGMMMRNDTTLEDLIPSDYDSVNTIFKQKAGVPLDMLGKTKPLLLTSMLYPTLLGCQPQSWDGAFMKMATEANMQVEGLELLNDQVKVMDLIPYKVQAEMLVKTLYNYDSARMMYHQMHDVYKNKDISELYKMTTGDEDFGAYENDLLITRNHNWIPVIGEQAKKLPTFFAFGAGHLGGEQGVISLLRKNGFKVEPVMY